MKKLFVFGICKGCAKLFDKMLNIFCKFAVTLEYYEKNDIHSHGHNAGNELFFL